MMSDQKLDFFNVAAISIPDSPCISVYAPRFLENHRPLALVDKGGFDEGNCVYWLLQNSSCLYQKDFEDRLALLTHLKFCADNFETIWNEARAKQNGIVEDTLKHE